MKKFWKIASSVTAVALVGCITITSASFLSKREEIEAKSSAAFRGVDGIVASNSEDNPLDIWELVPSLDMAEFAHMYDEKEVDNWVEMLKGIGSQSGRESYMNTTLAGKWSGLYRDDSEVNSAYQALNYQEYKESFALGASENADDYQMLEVVNDTLETGTTGYRMELLTDGDMSGDFLLSADYAVAPKDGDGNYQGTHRQSFDHYVYSSECNQYYGVAFESLASAGITLEEVDGELFSGGHKLYEVTSAEYIDPNDVETYNRIKTDKPNAYIYRLSQENIYGTYEYVGAISDEALSFENIKRDEENYYFSIGFTYVSSSNLSRSATYYVVKQNAVKVDDNGEEKEILVDDVRFFVDEANKGAGEYGPDMNLFVPIEDGEVGYFICTADESYKYQAGGTGGNYRMVKDSNGSLDHPATPGRIYYKGGFSDNHILERDVFHKVDETGKYVPGMSLKTKVVTPDLINNNIYNLENADILYISSRSLTKEREVGSQGSGFTATNDISEEALRQIYSLATSADKRLPVIVDKSILDGVDVSKLGESSYTNMQRLAALLSSTIIPEGSTEIKGDLYGLSEDTALSSIPWRSLVLPVGYDDYGYVIHNIYVYPGNKSVNGTPFIFDHLSDVEIAKGSDENTFVSSATDKGLKEIAEYINEENLARQKENESITDVAAKLPLFDKSITKATIVQYIINYINRREREWDKFKVLEIQPGRRGTEEYQTQTPELEVDYVKDNILKANSIKVNDVEITVMTTSEFIGTIEDLSRYDLIYFGADTSSFNKDGNGKTKYNDVNMNGLIYSNIGDILAFSQYKGTNGFTGLLDTDYNYSNNQRSSIKGLSTSDTKYDGTNGSAAYKKYLNAPNTYRFSGNDITDEKKTDVVNYVTAGYPVMINKDFVLNGAIDKDKVDDCSKIYDLFTEILDKENVILYQNKTISASDINSLMKYLKLGKPTLELLPHDLADYDTGGGKKFLKVENNTLELEFKVNNESAANPNAKFNFAFYLDINADGKFSSAEKLSREDMVLLENGNRIYGNPELEINPSSSNIYKFSYELGSGSVGLIPYKLEVFDQVNSLRSVSTQGYFYNKNTGQAVKIHVLQISSASQHSQRNNFNMETNAKFNELIKEVKDFEVHVRCLYSDNYAREYGQAADKSKYFETCCREKASSGGWVKDEAGNDKQFEADMLVIGFADMYAIANANGCVDGIVKFINSGKPVLFTHDTTSFYNNSIFTYNVNSTNLDSWNTFHLDYGYDFNKIVRNIVGMDRYGVLTNASIKEGNQLDQSEASAKFAAAVKSAVDDEKDLAYVPKSGKKKLARQCQGFLNGVMVWFAGPDNDKGPNGLYNSAIFNRDNWTLESCDGYVEQVNEGQITTYPFVIPKTFTPSNTHFQYYQLDMNEDKDGDEKSDIVVWYTLEGKKKSVYLASPKDVRNNYYIYTKGNVTYSGVGHSAVTKDDEVKLYINTLIAAYNAGVRPPTISLKHNKDDDRSPDITTEYVTFDQTLQTRTNAEGNVEYDENGNPITDVVDGAESIEQNLESKLYLKIKNNNLVRGQSTDDVNKQQARVFFGTLSNENDPTAKKFTIDGKDIYLKDISSQIEVKDGDGNLMAPVAELSGVTGVNGEIANRILYDSYHIGTGQTYEINVKPQERLGDKSVEEVYVVSWLVIKIETSVFDVDTGQNVSDREVSWKFSDPSMYKLKIQRLGLMDLD